MYGHPRAPLPSLLAHHSPCPLPLTIFYDPFPFIALWFSQYNRRKPLKKRTWGAAGGTGLFILRSERAPLCVFLYTHYKKVFPPVRPGAITLFYPARQIYIFFLLLFFLYLDWTQWLMFSNIKKTGEEKGKFPFLGIYRLFFFLSSHFFPLGWILWYYAEAFLRKWLWVRYSFLPPPPHTSRLNIFFYWASLVSFCQYVLDKLMFWDV